MTPPPRTADTAVPLHRLLADRWSPRGFDRTAVLDDRAVQGLLEAARWSPSASNTQPWRFLVGRRGDRAHDLLLAALAPGNAAWADAASALVLVAAETVDGDGRARPWAWYDAGQAAAALTLQAGADGLHVHQMGGFDARAVRDGLGLPVGLDPVVVLAVGRLDPDADLPEPFASRERAPRSRHPVEALLLDAPEPAEDAVA